MEIDNRPWIGFDFDGTLVKSTGKFGVEDTGEPIMPMVDLVKEFLRQGKRVKIVTARVGPPTVSAWDGRMIDVDYAAEARAHLEKWCKRYIGPVLEITATKDFNMICLYDDRAVQVIPDKGILLQDQFVKLRESIKESLAEFEIEAG